MSKKVFKVNKYVTLKLEEGKTNIYVKGRLFLQCKKLLAQLRLDEIDIYEEVNSIDELAERTSEDIEIIHHIIPQEDEFWGHCSNLQMWVEMKYDSRILHRSLAFPLLKEIADAGDNFAKQILKEEIIKRILSGNKSIIEYLNEENYFGYLDYKTLFSIAMKISLQKLVLRNKSLSKLPDSIGKLVSLIYLDLRDNKLTKLPESVGKLTSLEYLDLSNNEITDLPESISNLSSLQYLDLSHNELTTLPESFKKLKFLRTLFLNHNNLIKFPLIRNLEYIELSENKLEVLPESIGNLYFLEELYLQGNFIDKLPQSFGELENLNALRIDTPLVKQIPKNLKKKVHIL